MDAVNGRGGEPAHARAADRRVAVVRLAVLFSLLPLLWLDIIPPQDRIALIWLSALIAGYSLGTLFLFPALSVQIRRDVFLALDILAATALVYYTGGASSSLLPILFLPILGTAVRLDLRQTVMSALAASALVVWMWTMAGGAQSLAADALRVGLFTLGSLLFALVFGMLAQETRLSRQREALNRLLDERLAAATGQLRRRLAELESAYALARRLAAATDTSSVLEVVTEAAREQLRAPFAAVFLSTPAGGALSVAHARGITLTNVAPVLDTCASAIAAGRRSGRQEIAESVWQRALYAPIAAGDRLIGVLCAGGTEAWESTEEDALTGIADQGGTALERAYLLEDLQRLATANPVAHLFSRDQLDRVIRAEVARASQLGAPFALLKLTLDGIAGTGDRAGDSTMVDLVHRRAAAIVLEAARRVDVVAEAGRGEFFVLLAMTNRDAARKFAVEVHQRLRADAVAWRLLGSASGLDCRIGIAIFPDDAATGPELHFAAQKALEVAHDARRIVSAHELVA